MGKTEQIRVTRSSMPQFDEYVEEIRDLWDSHWLTNCGDKHNELEKKLQDYLDVPYLSLFVNGHNALECVIEALDLGADGRDEVITTPFTFVSTTNAIARNGLKPVFCDVRESDLTLDPGKIEELITDKTCAIVPVHVYGNMCDVDAIEAIAKKYDLKVVYDAAHAFGVERDGVGIGNFGDASMFSFHATKVFNTIEGGAVVHSDKELQNSLRRRRNFGIVNSKSVEYIAGNSKMNEFSAAMGLCNLRQVDNEIAKRKVIAERYWERLEGISGIRTIKPSDNIKHNYAYLPVLVEEEYGATRDEVFDRLAEAGIGARKYFYPLTSDFECYINESLLSSEATPVAYQAAERVITLPMYADLSLEDVDRICDVLLPKGND